MVYVRCGAKQAIRFPPPIEEISMLDLLYLVIALVFFAGSWLLVKACETL